MTIPVAIATFFTQIWRVFQVETPLMGLTFADIFLGSFVIIVGVRILHAAFGLSLFSARSGKGKKYDRKGEED